MEKVMDTFVNSPEKKYPSSHAATICELDNRDLLTAWFAGSKESAVDTVILASRLKRDETEYGSPEVLVNVDNHAAGNPRLFYGPDQALWLIAPINYGAWCHGGTRLFLKKSFDHGYTWTDLELFIEEKGILGKNKPIHLSSNPGIWLIPVEDEEAYICRFIRSEDGGRRWEIVGDLGRENNIRVDQPTIIEFDDGRLMAYMRSWEGYIYKSYSSDSGTTWSQVVPTPLVNNNSGIDMIQLKSGSILLVHNPNALSDSGDFIVDQSLKGKLGFKISVQEYNRDTKGALAKNPDILLLYPKWGPRTPLRVSVSFNQGESWEKINDLEDKPGEYSYPSIIQGEDGRIHVVYTYNRKKIKHVVFEEKIDRSI